MMTRSQKPLSLALALLLALAPCFSARAYQPGTLRSGMRGEAVKQMQLALISLHYLGGTADGIFGTNTENAVKKFQRASGLKADGLAGAKTLEKLYAKAGVSTSAQASRSSSSSSASSPSSSSSSPAASSSVSSATLFGGNYATLRTGSTGERVKTLQKQLISLGFLSGSADGKFGNMTRQAVVSFQKASGLTADGLAGKKTLQALESSGKASPGQSAPSSPASSQSSSGQASSGAVASGPSGASVKLLHWYNDVKPSLRNGQTLLVYEPSSGQSWNLRVYSCGRHCDAEPRTAEDTASLLKAFGGENTWSQKAVYVKLPNGTWTVGSTHSMPHESMSIKDNNFKGHLCVHFLRDMSEAQEKDPSYGVANQNTIRDFWKRLTGEVISN